MPTLFRLLGVATALATTSAAGYWGVMTLPPGEAPPPARAEATAPPLDDRARTTDGLAAPAQPAGFPGLGPRTAARIPASARQVVVVRGGDDARATVALYVHGPAGWTTDAVWPARTGQAGWVAPSRRTDGDRRSPSGVFTLGDAGGRAAAPSGTTLPYTRSDLFAAAGRGLDGGSLRGVFDHVVAIDFNRVRGRSPLDTERPDGWSRGGGIWFHVEHTGPTRGCVALPRAAMVALLRTLTPAARPVVVMGPAADLDR